MYFTIQGINAEIRRLTEKQLQLEQIHRGNMVDPSISLETKQEMAKVYFNKTHTLEEHVCFLMDQKEKMVGSEGRRTGSWWQHGELLETSLTSDYVSSIYLIYCPLHCSGDDCFLLRFSSVSSEKSRKPSYQQAPMITVLWLLYLISIYIFISSNDWCQLFFTVVDLLVSF